MAKYSNYNGSLYYDERILIEEPAIIIDVTEDMYTILKIGDAKYLSSYYQTMIDKYNEIGVTDMDVRLIIFDKYKFLNIDDIASIFNVAMNNTGHTILKKLVENNTDELKKEIVKIQKMGY